MDVVATELTSVAKPIKARALMILVIVTELVVNSPYPQSFYLKNPNQPNAPLPPMKRIALEFEPSLFHAVATGVPVVSIKFNMSVA